MQKFIYVFNKEERDKMINAGYTLLAENDKDSFYVFVNKPQINFDTMEIDRFVYSDVLTF